MPDDALSQKIQEVEKEIRRLTDIGFSEKADIPSEVKREANFMRRQKIEEKGRLLREQERPLLDDLKKLGIVVPTVAELGNRQTAFDELLPLLRGHLALPYHDQIKAAIGMVFMHSNARPYLDFFRKEFDADHGGYEFYEQIIANIIIRTAKMHDLPFVIDMIATSKKESRTILLTVLKKYRNRSKLAEDAVNRFAKDPYLAIEISRWPKPKAGKSKLAPLQ